MSPAWSEPLDPKSPAPTGHRPGKALTRERVDGVVTDYYRDQGWDEQTGAVPTPETLKSYNLDDPVFSQTTGTRRRLSWQDPARASSVGR